MRSSRHVLLLAAYATMRAVSAAIPVTESGRPQGVEHCVTAKPGTPDFAYTMAEHHGTPDS